ncbi:hypothetical protein JXB22_08175 [candidate division WOR-3 bacterium]|nr:hypothetical protein [candidate division WOR-3 bacterium]
MKQFVIIGLGRFGSSIAIVPDAENKITSGDMFAVLGGYESMEKLEKV